MVHLHFHKQVPVCIWSLVMVLAVEIEWDACEWLGEGKRVFDCGRTVISIIYNGLRVERNDSKHA